MQPHHIKDPEAGVAFVSSYRHLATRLPARYSPMSMTVQTLPSNPLTFASAFLIPAYAKRVRRVSGATVVGVAHVENVAGVEVRIRAGGGGDMRVDGY